MDNRDFYKYLETMRENITEEATEYINDVFSEIEQAANKTSENNCTDGQYYDKLR